MLGTEYGYKIDSRIPKKSHREIFYQARNLDARKFAAIFLTARISEFEIFRF